HWGDGGTSNGTVSFSGGAFTISGSHSYLGDCTFNITADVKDVGGSTFNDIPGATTIDVADNNFSANPGPAITGTEGATTGPVTVATFTNANGLEDPTDYMANIDWGDGSTTFGATVTQPGGPGTSYVVNGSHTPTPRKAVPSMPAPTPTG